MSDSSVATRLKHFMEFKGIAITQFADRCGIPRPSLSQLLSGRNKKLSDLVVKQIHDQFPELSVLWLMFGEGDMLVPKPISPAIIDEAAKFMDDMSDIDVDANLNELTDPIIEYKSAENKQVNPQIANANIVNKIENNSQKPRKVVSITIFYDDNSYETFFPENKPKK